MSDSESEGELEESEELEVSSADQIFRDTKTIIDELGETVNALDKQIENLTSFYEKIKGLSSFTEEEKSKLKQILKSQTAEREQKVKEMQKKLQVYENEILTITSHIQERSSVLEDDAVSTVLEEHEELMEMMVGRQAELTMKLKNSSNMIIDDE